MTTQIDRTEPQVYFMPERSWTFKIDGNVKRSEKTVTIEERGWFVCLEVNLLLLLGKGLPLIEDFLECLLILNIRHLERVLKQPRRLAGFHLRINASERQLQRNRQ